MTRQQPLFTDPEFAPSRWILNTETNRRTCVECGRYHMTERIQESHWDGCPHKEKE